MHGWMGGWDQDEAALLRRVGNHHSYLAELPTYLLTYLPTYPPMLGFIGDLTGHEHEYEHEYEHVYEHVYERGKRGEEVERERERARERECVCVCTSDFPSQVPPVLNPIHHTS